jgi:hypothetical protein
LHSLWGNPPERFTSQAFWDALERILPDRLDPLATGEEDPLDRAQLRLLDLWKGKQMERRHLLAYDTTNFHTYIASNNTRHELAQRGHNQQGCHNLRQGPEKLCPQDATTDTATASGRRRAESPTAAPSRPRARLRDRKQLTPGVQAASAGERFDP